MRLGSGTVSAVRVGSGTVSRIYLGASLAWEPAGSGLTWSATGAPEAVTVTWTGSNSFTATGAPEAVTVEWT